jgi:hypothetical protein
MLKGPDEVVDIFSPPPSYEEIVRKNKECVK